MYHNFTMHPNGNRKKLYEVVVRPDGGASIPLSIKAKKAGAQSKRYPLTEGFFQVPDQTSRQGTIERGE